MDDVTPETGHVISFLLPSTNESLFRSRLGHVIDVSANRRSISSVLRLDSLPLPALPYIMGAHARASATIARDALSMG